MSDEEKPTSGWTNPPKGKLSRKEKAKAAARRKGSNNTVRRRQTAEKVAAELEAGLDEEQRAMPPLMDAFDLLPPPAPIPELTAQEKHDGGRGATTYREEYARIARMMCELGATDIQVAQALGVTLSTMWGWQSRHEEFFRAMIIGKDLPDEKVVRALYQRAVGYTYPEIQLKTVGGRLYTIPTLTHIPPDVSACMGWLRARRREEWSETKNLNLTSDETFKNLWLAVAKGQTLPMIDVDAEVVEDGQG